MLLPFVMCLICSDDDGDSRFYRITPFYGLILKLKPTFLLLSCCVSIMHSSFVCGQQLFRVFKFRNTHSKIFEKIARHFSDVQTECEILLPLRLLDTHYECSIFVQGRTQGRGRAAGLQPPPQTPKTEIKKKKTGFVDIMISNLFREFPFSRNQPLKSADDRYIRILKKYT
jgi:hypothetical protein